MKILSILATLLLGFVLNNCKPNQALTVEEFKEKYNWDTSVIRTIEYTRGEFFMSFYYNGKEYTSFHMDATLYWTDMFQVIFDKNNPDRNYKIIWYLPVKPISSPFGRIYGKIIHFNKWRECVGIDYDYFNPDGSKISRRTEYLPLKYFDILKPYYDSKEQIPVRLYKVDFEDRFYWRPFIDIDLIESTIK